MKVMEEAELERLRAVEAVRSKYEEKFLQQVQELQRQVRDLQSSVKVTTMQRWERQPHKAFD